MAPTPASLKKQPLTLAQLSSYDDILTDALVDHAFYWTTIPKNRPSYHPSRGIREEEITKIVQSDIIVNPDLQVAESKLLATDGLRKFYNALKTDKEKEDFRAHLRRYMQIYLPDCPFEVSSTNRYTIVSHEAAVTARKFLKKGQPIKYLSGIRVTITEKEDNELSKRKKDFSIVVSSRNKCAALFMGPARFANHDCAANARLMITGQSGIEIVATQNIEVGEEITVSYAENYFGEDNCECLCKTCEDKGVNGWSQGEGGVALKKSIEESMSEGYSLRRRRRDDSCASASRTPSVTPDIRPRIRKTKSKTAKVDSEAALLTGSPEPQGILRQKRKREFDALQTPPVTPAKKLKTLQYEVQPVSVPTTLSRRSSDDTSLSGNSLSDSGSVDLILTDVSTPEEDPKESILQSPVLTPTKQQTMEVKQESTDTPSLSEVGITPSLPITQEPSSEVPLPTIETMTQSDAEPATLDPVSDTIEVLGPIEPIALPPPATLISSEVTQDSQSSLGTGSSAEEGASRGRSRARGKPRKGGERSVEACDEEPTGPTSKRTPGDYTLTPVLLSEPNTAWIHCTNCGDPFVQQNAYYTRSSCPRCERHSKLYGYQWPKTEKEGKNDKEERILDHRTVHRFLTADDEAKIRGRRLPSSAAKSTFDTIAVATVETKVETKVEVKVQTAGETPAKRPRGRPKKNAVPASSPQTGHGDEDGDSNTKRNFQRRHLSQRAVEC
ncbi:hypothetical protein F4809DRAFT_41461 [Biscogniauxia mediterranea]|nr:hypothetical protein F4809DRAFT_41461 [Biscogniauxia mediterranea]